MHIQSFARLMNVTPRTLRFYEEKGLLQPIKDEENGYRTYSMDDAFRLQTILSLREAGLTLPEIREVLEKLDQGNKRELLRDLELQRAALTTQWLDLRDRLKTTERMIQLLQTGSVQWSDIHELTVGARRMREVRQKWQDSWGFNQWADHFDVEVEDRWPGYEELLQATVDAVELSHGSMGLEVGVGTGNLCAKLIEAGATMVGIDPSMAMLDQCSRKPRASKSFPLPLITLPSFLPLRSAASAILESGFTRSPKLPSPTFAIALISAPLEIQFTPTGTPA